jgi:hypothetical protein
VRSPRTACVLARDHRSLASERSDPFGSLTP